MRADLEKSARERERAEKDFVGTEENLGSLDIESFFEKAVQGGLAGGDNDDGSEDEEENSGSKTNSSNSDSEDDLNSLGSEEEDIEASEARLKKQLEELAENDPEFHKYLKENESSLLEYGEDDDEDGGDYVQDEDNLDIDLDEMEDDGEDEGKSPKKKTAKKEASKQSEDKFLLTPQRLESLEQGAFESHSIKGLKRIISAYKTACHLSDASRQDKAEDSDDDEAPKRNKREFQITSPVVFDRLMAVCLSQCHEEFYRHFLDGDTSEQDGSDDEDSDSGDEEGDTDAKTVDENKPINPKLLFKSSNWPILRPYLESFLKSTLHLLSEAGKEANLQKFVLQSLAKYVPLLTAFPKISKPMLKICVKG